MGLEKYLKTGKLQDVGPLHPPNDIIYATPRLLELIKKWAAQNNVPIKAEAFNDRGQDRQVVANAEIENRRIQAGKLAKQINSLPGGPLWPGGVEGDQND